jgi:hypothetical protein
MVGDCSRADDALLLGFFWRLRPGKSHHRARVGAYIAGAGSVVAHFESPGFLGVRKNFDFQFSLAIVHREDGSIRLFLSLFLC